MPKTNYYYFTEQPYTGYDPALQEQYPALRLNLPNTHYDPQLASDLYNRYHDEYQVADDVGFDGRRRSTSPAPCWPRSPGAAKSSCSAIRCPSSIIHCGSPKS